MMKNITMSTIVATELMQLFFHESMLKHTFFIFERDPWANVLSRITIASDALFFGTFP